MCGISVCSMTFTVELIGIIILVSVVAVIICELITDKKI